MVHLDEDELDLSLKELLGRETKRALRAFVNVQDKHERIQAKILCLCDYRVFIISINKNNKPNRVETVFHFLDIKKFESTSGTQLSLSTHDNREFRFTPLEQTDFPNLSTSSTSRRKSRSSSDLDVLNTNLNVGETNSSTNCSDDELLNKSNENELIDDIIECFCRNLLDVFPSVTIRNLFESVLVKPDARLDRIYESIHEKNKLKKRLQICDNYSKAYNVHADWKSTNCYQEVVWDVNVIYGQNALNEFSLNDFDYVNSKDFCPLLSALNHNKWFESFFSESIKFTNEMQEELIQVLTTSSSSIRGLSLIQANLRSDFLNRLQAAFNTKSTDSSIGTHGFKAINLNRNSIEDKGLLYLANMFKENPRLCKELNQMSFSKCSISSKSINSLFAGTDFTSKLTHLNLSYNFLKDEPTEFFKFISEPNQLTELNLTSTEVDIEKLFLNLSKGGCDTNLKKLFLSNNYGLAKLANGEHMVKYLHNTKALNHLDCSNCKLNGSAVQIILASLKLNKNLGNGFFLNLSSNDLGSNLRVFMNDFTNNSVLTGLDLSDNNLDSDCESLFYHMQQSNIRSLSLARNFHNCKSKVIARIIQALTKWLTDKNSNLEELYLNECKLKSNLNDFVSELGTFENLLLLDISGNEVGEFGINLLSKSLQVNRTLETLIFDKSNVSIQAYSHILDSLKRNYSIKTIQLPLNDICILYQKSPEKIVEIVKQMTEQLAQRSLLNAKQKCDINQLFKTKMKLINDASVTNASLALNASSSNSSSQSSLLNQQINSNKTNGALADELLSAHDACNTNEINSNLAAVNPINSLPTSIKEVMVNLNETASKYLDENSVEKGFDRFEKEIESQLDAFCADLERELQNSLKNQYPKLKSALKESHDSTNHENKDIAKMKANVRNYMSSMLVQMHNDICELTYKLSSSMAEKVKNESVLQQQQHQQQQTAIASAIIKSNQQSSAKGQQNEATQQQSIINTTNGVDKTHVNSSGASGVEPSLAKKLFGGVKLPFAHFHPSTSSASTATTMASSTQLANNNETSSNDSADSTVQHRLEILNNSKTKRPISTQIYDSETSTTNSNDKHRRQPSTGSPQRNQSPQSRESNLSTSNENIASDDDELAASKKTPIISKRSKTPDSRDDQSNGPVVSIKGYNSQNKPNAPTSTSMNIIKKIKDEIRSPKKENAIDASNSANAPNPAPRNKAKVFVDKLFRSNKEPTTTSVISSSPPNLSSAVNGPKAANIDMTSPQSSKNDEIKMTNDQPVQLQHFNKDRARRPNVKRPTVKNPHSSIKIEPNNEDLSLSLEDATNKTVKTPVETETSKTNVSSLSGETEDTKSSPPKQTSPAVNLLRSNQPAVSLTALANIRSELKSRLPPKLTEESATNEISSTETASSQLAINQAPASNTSSTTTTASSKLANRLSMFEQTGSIISMNPKPYKRNDLVSNSNNSSSDSAFSPNQENNTNSSESNPQLDASSKTSKPLPPIPPLKPRTTAPVAISNKIATTSNDQPTQPNIFVKLRPVNTNNTNPVANGNSELSSNNEEKPIVNRLDKEKRSSVKEVVQMFSEESKA